MKFMMNIDKKYNLLICILEIRLSFLFIRCIYIANKFFLQKGLLFSSKLFVLIKTKGIKMTNKNKKNIK